MKIYAIDLFCGIGGLTHGLIQSGIDVKAGVDNDISCRSAYEQNNKGATFIGSGIQNVSANELNQYYQNADFKVMVGCAPCQPFSAHRIKRTGEDERFSLLLEVSRLVEECKPDIVSVENVPGLMKQMIYSDFKKRLKGLGLRFFDEKIVFCPKYGVPQTRKRLVLLASRFGDIELIPPPYPEKKKWQSMSTVKKFLKGLPSIKAGERCANDLYHAVPNLSEINLKRIRQSVPGGNWRDWKEDIVPMCRKRSSYNSPYGRMAWDEPAPTITTQFFGYSHGRFGHPVEDRAISLREGSLLQTFPKSYKFHDAENEIFSISRIARHIGNAVPVKLANYIGKSIIGHINEHSR